MQQQAGTIFQTTFHREVYQGLTNRPKYISSKYFYDQLGDKLFQKIMEMPDYYLTRTEYNIFQVYKSAICEQFIADGSPFSLIELGAGDGKKTKVLLRELLAKGGRFKYQPVDISPNALTELEAGIERELPEVVVDPLQGTYFEALEKLNNPGQERKVLLFLGSNIGNLLHPQALDFLQGLNRRMGPEDLLFIGFDQKKHPQKILNAYNDPEGITAAFNKNVLVRINRELGGNFDPDSFLHWETYNPESGTARSYLVASRAQSVTLTELNLTVHFDAWETIHTEISQKYDSETIQWLARKASLQPVEEYGDPQGAYKNYIFKKK